jgi:isochorismate hydrolase
LREDPPKAPDGATFFYNDAFKGMAATGNDMAAKAGELATNAASSVSDAVGKIDWDELQSNMQAFVKSTEVQKLKETSVRGQVLSSGWMGHACREIANMVAFSANARND